MIIDNTNNYVFLWRHTQIRVKVNCIPVPVCTRGTARARLRSRGTWRRRRGSAGCPPSARGAHCTAAAPASPPPASTGGAHTTPSEHSHSGGRQTKTLIIYYTLYKYTFIIYWGPLGVLTQHQASILTLGKENNSYILINIHILLGSTTGCSKRTRPAFLLLGKKQARCSQHINIRVH